MDILAQGNALGKDMCVINSTLKGLHIRLVPNITFIIQYAIFLKNFFIFLLECCFAMMCFLGFNVFNYSIGVRLTYGKTAVT